MIKDFYFVELVLKIIIVLFLFNFILVRDKDRDKGLWPNKTLHVD